MVNELEAENANHLSTEAISKRKRRTVSQQILDVEQQVKELQERLNLLKNAKENRLLGLKFKDRQRIKYFLGNTTLKMLFANKSLAKKFFAFVVEQKIAFSPALIDIFGQLGFSLPKDIIVKKGGMKDDLDEEEVDSVGLEEESN